MAVPPCDRSFIWTATLRQGTITRDIRALYASGLPGGQQQMPSSGAPGLRTRLYANHRLDFLRLLKLARWFIDALFC
jgi:hypothetical protein